ncbi:hypothetical protein TIFTF001_043893 [Ficus carica]|uniref:Uncharacterized protein n=1 Tax=Ficus carica TaxID=3494 RepID=A0AA88D313_FICCA|nr:hypothetical protein TIFTF001_043885 [Ficus carica]GMN25380.1 hypothetical protein TIFTF001_043888 [Ficus carica]GMN25406.1 hypothetical protein TIFTF001_043890 [Ficus carica]GMN25419.1 hypothetical protein TIFTF001_043893 [Ficus carica]
MAPQNGYFQHSPHGSPKKAREMVGLLMVRRIHNRWKDGDENLGSSPMMEMQAHDVVMMGRPRPRGNIPWAWICLEPVLFALHRTCATHGV